MNRPSPRSRLAVFLAVWALLWSGSPGAAGEPGRAGPGEVWQTLRYRGKSWLGKMSAELVLSPSASPVESEVAAGGPLWIAEVRSELDARFAADRRTTVRARFDPLSGMVRQLTRLHVGPKPDYKRYDFGARGVERLRIEPSDAMLRVSPDQWSGGTSSFHAYDPERTGCRTVSEPGALAYWLSWGPAAETARAEDPGVCVFWGKTLYRVSFVYQGPDRARVDYRVRDGATTRRRSGRVAMDRWSIEGRPVAGELDEEPTRTQVLVEAETWIPWRFSQQEGPVEVEMELEEVVLGDPATTRLGLRGR